LAKSRALRFIELQATGMTAEGAEKLRRALPRATILVD
jgi:hypothetical protein